MKTDQVESQRKIFNKEFAQISSSNPEPWQISYIERIETFLLNKSDNNKSIIELGSGDGRLSLYFAKKGYKVTACDISDKAVELTKKFAKKNNIQLEVKRCDVTKLPFKSNSFDYAIAGAILEHLQDEDAALKEWSRILKPNGKIFIVTPVRQRHVLPIWWVLNWFHDRRLGHMRRYDKKRYSTFKRYHLELYKTIYTGHTPKVLLTILHMVFPNKSIQIFAEKIDHFFLNMEFDANNITGFFKKTKS